MAEDNIFSEVDEELRNERMRNLWKKYAPFIFALAGAIIFLVAAKEGWDYYQKSVSSKSADKFYAAIDLLQNNNIEKGKIALDKLIEEGSGQYPLLAEFRKAAILLNEGKNQQAAENFDNIANRQSDKNLRNLALLYSALALSDLGDVEAVNARLSGLIAADNPFSVTAQEILGLTYYAGGDIDKAREIFTNITTNPLASNDSLSRAQIYIAQLIAQGAKEPQSLAATQIINNDNNADQDSNGENSAN